MRLPLFVFLSRHPTASFKTRREAFIFTLDSCLTVAQWATLNKGKPDSWEVNTTRARRLKMIELEWIENDPAQAEYVNIGAAMNDCSCSNGEIYWD